MWLSFIDTFIKSFGTILCTGYCFSRIINYKDLDIFNRITILFLCIVLTIIECTLKYYISISLSTIIISFIYNIILCIFTRNKLGHSLIVTILSISISYVAFSISTVIVFIPITALKITDVNNPINFIIISILEFILIYYFFKVPRFKNGFPFLKNKIKNDYTDIFILIVSTITIFMYFLIGNYKDLLPQYLFLGFTLSFMITVVILRKIFVLYQKQKLLEKTLKEYEAELKEKDAKLEQLLKEENKLTKANHEFYHRQEALKYKLINLQNTSKENFNEEYGELIDKIDALSKEYKDSIENSKILQKLPKTNIVEIDDMFSYLQHECQKNDIEFTLKINGNMHSIINHIIPKNKLETLIGDLIRNSIIAINYSSKEYRSIMAILGVKENIYELCIYDSGIEFKINTLQKLGIERATTHKESGGTGIGFITTFETLNYCNASLIIHELEPNFNNYSKSITVRFDGKHQYIIDTYRFSEMNNINIYRNDIIIRKSK